MHNLREKSGDNRRKKERKLSSDGWRETLRNVSSRKVGMTINVGRAKDTLCRSLLGKPWVALQMKAGLSAGLSNLPCESETRDQDSYLVRKKPLCGGEAVLGECL